MIDYVYKFIAHLAENIYVKVTTIIVGIISTIAALIGFFTDNGAIKGLFIGVFVGILITVALFKLGIFDWFKRRISYPIGRHSEIKRLIGKIKTGQSTAIVGVFGGERTQILSFLRNTRKLYGYQEKNIIFSFLDLSLVDEGCTPTQFWEMTLKPVIDNPLLKNNYNACEKNGFNNNSLHELFSKMNKNKLQLVLLFDRFHEILYKTHLKQQHFLGTLRAIAQSSNPSPLCLIVTANESLTKLYQDIMQEAPTNTSPFLNFMDEITLGILPENEVDLLLEPYHFSDEIKSEIKTCIGGHPYLLMLFANRLKEAYDARENNSFELAKSYFTDNIHEQLSRMLRSWSQKTCLAFVLIAQQTGDVSIGFEDELRELKRQGLIYQQNGQWHVLSPVFSELLEDKDIQELCANESI
ncbi:MAG: AAA-like domain-containing protein [Thiotrichaceae bacterium]|nr:AAA-like domain-containing protein [Thiotrichaceae bacterium]